MNNLLSMESLYTFITGLAVGIIFTLIFCRARSIGYFVIDKHDPEKDVFRLEVTDMDIYDIEKCKYIQMKVRKDHTKHLLPPSE